MVPVAIVVGRHADRRGHRPLLPVVIAAILRGTGRFNIAQGAVATLAG